MVVQDETDNGCVCREFMVCATQAFDHASC
jgi:hypothetical protein